MSVGFRPTPADNEIIQAHKRPEESTSDVLRRALRALDRQKWDEQARQDMERIAATGEDLSDEPDDWGYDEEGRPVDHHTEQPGKRHYTETFTAFTSRPSRPAPVDLGSFMARDTFRDVLITHDTRNALDVLRGSVAHAVEIADPSAVDVVAEVAESLRQHWVSSSALMEGAAPVTLKEHAPALLRQHSSATQDQPTSSRSTSWKHAHLRTLARRAAKR